MKFWNLTPLPWILLVVLVLVVLIVPNIRIRGTRSRAYVVERLARFTGPCGTWAATSRVAVIMRGQKVSLKEQVAGIFAATARKLPSDNVTMMIDPTHHLFSDTDPKLYPLTA